MSAERRVGSSGLLVSAVGLGCNNFGRSGTVTETIQGTRAVLDAAIDSGVTFLDTADMYGKHPGLSEILMGEALEGRRDRVVLATKFGHSSFDMGYDFPPRADPAAISAKPSKSLCAGCAPRGSTSTSYTRRIRRRPSKKRWTRSTNWSARARSATSFCDDRGITMLEATFGWLLAQPGVASVIAGATSPAQVEANARAGSAWSPPADDLAAIDALFPLPKDPAA